MVKPAPGKPAPALDDPEPAAAAKPSAAVKLAQLMARAHQVDDPGRRPILVKLPSKARQ
jgi:hypothetical protein